MGGLVEARRLLAPLLDLSDFGACPSDLRVECRVLGRQPLDPAALVALRVREDAPKLFTQGLEDVHELGDALVLEPLVDDGELFSRPEAIAQQQSCLI